MEDLFGYSDRTHKSYRRDAIGRFADERTAKYEKAVKDAAKYKAMYEKELSRSKGFSKMIRIKDNIINKLKGTL